MRDRRSQRLVGKSASFLLRQVFRLSGRLRDVAGRARQWKLRSFTGTSLIVSNANDITRRISGKFQGRKGVGVWLGDERYDARLERRCLWIIGSRNKDLLDGKSQNRKDESVDDLVGYLFNGGFSKFLKYWLLRDPQYQLSGAGAAVLRNLSWGMA